MTAEAETVPGRHALDAEDITGSLREPERFTAIYDRHFPAVYRYVAGRLGPQAADDLAAETFLIAFRKRQTFDARRGAVRPWLFGIATNLVAQHKRDETRRYRALARAGAEPTAGQGHEDRVVTLVTAQRMQPRLARALAALSQGERDVVLLVALSGFGHDEVAEALGIPYGTVGSRLSRARTKLRAALDQEASR
ncbi:MAG TPA: RNA polymerase sigma factor [Thermomonospora sp.]|nr:RNA polymerase sigma factor [Thermomonospora sp.]